MEQYDIFISYRRKDAGDKAEHLKDLLESKFKGRISFDRENLTGLFDVALAYRIERCKDFLLVVGKNSLVFDDEDMEEKQVKLYNYLGSCSQSEFEQKIVELGPDAPIDFVRIEIARALHRKDINIIPVVPETNESFNFCKLNLPDDIVDVKRYEPVFYSDNPDAQFKDVVPKILPRLHTKQESLLLSIINMIANIGHKHNENLIDSYVPKKVEFDIFISYRRVDGREHARNIQLALKGHGYKHIFFDYDSIQRGEFNKRIIDAIYSCTDFILVLSPKSMKRCTKDGDPVANEIRTAVKYKKNIIPVTIDGKEVKWPRSLPDDLKFIKGLQFHDHKSDSYFEHSIDELCEKLTCKKS